MPTNRLCVEHGGDVDVSDAYFACDACARSGINKCACGSFARYFGEALMSSVSCESCNEHVSHIGLGLNMREAWNSGRRGEI